MDIIEIKLKIYECTKSEYIEHIKIRNGSLVAYLGIVGVLMSGVLSMQNPKFEILLSLPFISLGIAFIIGQHNMAISSISKYCANDLNDKKLPLWESSQSLHEFSKTAVIFTTIGNLISLTIPAIVSLMLNWSLLYGNETYRVVMIMDIVLTVLTVCVVLYAGYWRIKRYGNIKW
jgi:hypothetical protein